MRKIQVTVHGRGQRTSPSLENAIMRECRKYESTVTIQKGRQTAVADNLPELANLCLRDGDGLELQIDGSDEVPAAIALQIFFQHAI